eukprot:XP_016657487.1 PREDICTED: uncharacterized protein LOC107882895 [Acyrthosiphon pisum]
MMKYIRKILLLLAITYSVFAAPKNGDYTAHRMTYEDIRDRNHIQDSLNGLLCPPVGLIDKYEVMTIQTTMTMNGCAYMEKAVLPSLVPLFHLWIERPEKTMVHGHCNDLENMDHLIFECLSKENPTNRIDVEKGWKYISLLEHIAEEKSPTSMKNETKSVRKSFRCAMYDVTDYDLDGVRIIRIAIAKARDEISNVQQCEGLGNLLGESALPFVSEGEREWPDGSLYLYMIGKKPYMST